MVSSVIEENEYTLLKDLRLEIDGGEDGTFSLSFWLYLVNSTSFPATIIRQVHSNIANSVPFLVFDESKKMMLLQLPFLHKETPDPANSTPWKQVPYASADIEFPLARWVHVGCEVCTKFARIYINGDIVGESALASSLTNQSNSNGLKSVTLVGTDGNDDGVQGYVHNAEILPLKSSMKQLYIKDPPLHLSIDISSVSDIEEDSDGVWSVVGGKAPGPHSLGDPRMWPEGEESNSRPSTSLGGRPWHLRAPSRKNFSFDVVLSNALGQTVNKEMEIIASLLYDDNGAPVDKPNDAEAPLLTSYDGIEFASCDRPSKLLQGRASFILAISQLSSKCDNRLFRIRFGLFGIPKVGTYPFLKAFSHPIRCISHNRNIRPSSLMLSKSSSAIHLPNGSRTCDEVFSDIQHNASSEAKHTSASKRIKSGQEKSSQTFKANFPLDESEEEYFSHAMTNTQVCHGRSELENGLDGAHLAQITSLPPDCVKDYGNSEPEPFISELLKVQTAFGTSLERRPENHEETHKQFHGPAISVCSLSDSESIEVKGSPFKSMSSSRIQISDLTVFKYCLGGLNERALLLKELATSAYDKEFADFAQQVSLYSGCFHHRNQIIIAKKLIEEGTKAWDMISQNNDHVPWESIIFYIEDQFMKIARCNSRSLSQQDFEILRRVAGCREYMARENFEKLWCWLYPVAVTLSRDRINAMWGSTSPKWIEGFVTKEEAEFSLQGPRGLQEPGTFILRFPTSRSWPHPDAGSLVVTYVGSDYSLHHRLLSLDYISSSGANARPLHEMLLAEPDLSRLGRITRNY